MTMEHKPSEYMYIHAWGRYLGSDSWYIRGEQAAAALEHAPLDALYKRTGEQGWARFDELPPTVKRIVGRYLPSEGGTGGQG